MSKQKSLDSEIIEEKVKCEICGKEFEQITYAHLKTHDITISEYKEQFPHVLLISEGLRKKLSGENHPMFGKYHSEESKQKMRDSSPHLSGEKNHMHGKHHTDEAKQKNREAQLGKKRSEETKQKMRDSSPHLSGKDHPMYGVHRCGKDAPNYGNEAWNKGETKETNVIVKESAEKCSKTLKKFFQTEEGKKVAKQQGETKKAFFQTEEGQKWLDENNRGENAPMYGKKSCKKGLTKETNESIKRGAEKSSKTKKEFFQTEEGRKFAEECGNRFRGKNPWNYGETKETNESIRQYGENGSKTKKEFFASEEGQKWIDDHMRGENSSAYKGGISYLPYCEKFDEDLKERVRNFFDRKCYVCGKNEEDNGQCLSVHHVNYDKMVCCNDVKPLFVPLCKSCHGKTQKDRKGWEEFFTASLEYLTNGQCFLPKEEIKK